MRHSTQIELRPARREDFMQTVRYHYMQKAGGKVLHDLNVCFEYPVYGKDFWVKQEDGSMEHHRLIVGMEASFKQKLEQGVVWVVG